MTMPKADKLIEQLGKLCAVLPEVTVEAKGDHATFRVRKKVFAYFLNNHHGDGVVSICCKGTLGEHTDRVRREPDRFYLPAYIGPRGWFGLRLDRGKVNWQEVDNILRLSYSLSAPKTLVKQLDI